jgi:hypothetical protein
MSIKITVLLIIAMVEIIVVVTGRILWEVKGRWSGIIWLSGSVIGSNHKSEANLTQIDNSTRRQGSRIRDLAQVRCLFKC